MPDHVYPKDGEHLWSKWYHKTGLPNATQYRTCLVEGCNAVEERPTPRS